MTRPGESGPPGHSPQTASDRRSVWELGLLFGAVYFVQGIAEPNTGLIAQPLVSMLRTWDYSAADISRFATLLALPWSLKPLYGLLTDFVPLFGYRRKSYLLLTSGVTAASLGILYALPPA